MAEESRPADQDRDNDSGDPEHSATEVTLTDLIDEIERAAFQRALDNRDGGRGQPVPGEPPVLTPAHS